MREIGFRLLCLYVFFGCDEISQIPLKMPTKIQERFSISFIYIYFFLEKCHPHVNNIRLQNIYVD